MFLYTGHGELPTSFFVICGSRIPRTILWKAVLTHGKAVVPLQDSCDPSGRLFLFEFAFVFCAYLCSDVLAPWQMSKSGSVNPHVYPSLQKSFYVFRAIWGPRELTSGPSVSTEGIHGLWIGTVFSLLVMLVNVLLCSGCWSQGSILNSRNLVLTVLEARRSKVKVLLNLVFSEWQFLSLFSHDLIWWKGHTRSHEPHL